MASQNRTDAVGTTATPSEGITLTFTTVQVDYLRELVFDDLKDWADMLRDMAWSASEVQGRVTAAADAESACEAARTGDSTRPHMATLDILGWEHPEHLARREQLQRERGEHRDACRDLADTIERLLNDLPEGKIGRDAYALHLNLRKAQHMPRHEGDES